MWRDGCYQTTRPHRLQDAKKWIGQQTGALSECIGILRPTPPGSAQEPVAPGRRQLLGLHCVMRPEWASIGGHPTPVGSELRGYAHEDDTMADVSGRRCRR